MKTTRLINGIVLMLVVFCLAGDQLLAVQQAQQENPAVKLSTDLVSLNVSVFDRNGNAAMDLKKDDFRLFENGVDQSLSFSSTDETPVSWGLVLDRSGSMQRMIRDVYQAALHVMDEGTDEDEMFVATFNTRVELAANFTRNRRALQNSVAGLRADGDTALYDAIAFGLDRMRLGSHQKKALVVVTDGDDNSSRTRFKDLVERAKEAEVLVYTIGMFGSMNSIIPNRDEMSRVGLVSLQFFGAEGGGMGGGQTLPNGAAFSVVRVQVQRKKKAKYSLPDRLSTINRYRLEEAVNAGNPRSFAVSARTMRLLLNGRTFELEGVAANEIVRLGTLEAWQFTNQGNAGGMMGGAMAHPLHVHGVQFQVTDRQVSPQFASAWETVRAGYVDDGWKDTVLLMPGESVKLLLRFEDYTGLYVYHCHILEHEDQGMMRNYLVSA